MASIGSLLQKGSTTTAEMRVLHGRLVFVEAQLFGRLAGVHMKQLSSFESMVGGTQIDEDLKRIVFLTDRVLNGEPRKLLSDVGRVYHLYTDACFEGGQGDLGGVLFDEKGAMLSFFSEVASPEAIRLINPQQKKGVIFELETLATAIGVTHLLPIHALRPCDGAVIFLDNESSLASLVSASGSLTPDNVLFGAILQWEYDVRAVCWYERVASHSNLADDPSRGKCEHFNPSLRVSVDPLDVLQGFMSNVDGL